MSTCMNGMNILNGKQNWQTGKKRHRFYISTRTHTHTEKYINISQMSRCCSPVAGELFGNVWVLGEGTGLEEDSNSCLGAGSDWLPSSADPSGAESSSAGCWVSSCGIITSVRSGAGTAGTASSTVVSATTGGGTTVTPSTVHSSLPPSSPSVLLTSSSLHSMSAALKTSPSNDSFILLYWGTRLIANPLREQSAWYVHLSRLSEDSGWALWLSVVWWVQIKEPESLPCV